MSGHEFPIGACPSPSKLSLPTGDPYLRLMRGSFSPPDPASQTACRSVQPFLHSSRQKIPIPYNECLFPAKLPFPMGRSGPPSNTSFTGPIQSDNPNGISIGLAIFTQITAECPYTLQWATAPPSKLSPPMGDMDSHLIHAPLSPPESSA